MNRRSCCGARNSLLAIHFAEFRPRPLAQLPSSATGGGRIAPLRLFALLATLVDLITRKPPHLSSPQQKRKAIPKGMAFSFWLRGPDLNRRPPGYEPDELPNCSTPRYGAPECPYIIAQGWGAVKREIPAVAWYRSPLFGKTRRKWVNFPTAMPATLAKGRVKCYNLSVCV